MPTQEKPSANKAEEYYIVSSDLLNWIRSVAFTKLTMQEVNGVEQELWDTPTLSQYLELQKEKKPRIIY